VKYCKLHTVKKKLEASRTVAQNESAKGLQGQNNIQFSDISSHKPAIYTSSFFLPFPFTYSGFPISFLLCLVLDLPVLTSSCKIHFPNTFCFLKKLLIKGPSSHWLMHSPSFGHPFLTTHTSSLLSLIFHQNTHFDTPFNLVYHSGLLYKGWPYNPYVAK